MMSLRDNPRLEVLRVPAGAAQLAEQGPRPPLELAAFVAERVFTWHGSFGSYRANSEKEVLIQMGRELI